MNPISTIASAVTPTSSFSFPSLPSPTGSGPAGPSFGDTLKDALSNVNSLQNKAGAMAQDFAVGRTSDVHSVMIAAQQATIALQLTTEVRNKAVEAYQNIMSITM